MGTIKPTGDLGFKKILASHNHQRVTQGFIADFFGLKVRLADIHIADPYSIKSYQERLGADEAGIQQRLHETIRDVTVAVKNVDITVEMQIRTERHFVARAYYYLADRYTSHYREDPSVGRNKYASLRPVWSLNVLDGSVFDCAHAFHMFAFTDPDTGEALTPPLARFGFLELDKHKRDTAPARRRWRRFLKTGIVYQSDPSYLKEAASIIDYDNLTQEERDMDKRLQKAIDTREAEMAYAIEQGVAQGIAQGIAQGVRERQLSDARAALRWGVPREGVVAITGLDASAVDGLAQELGFAGS